MTYKAVGFDWGGVIGGSGKTQSHFAEDASQLLGIELEEYKKEYFKINHLINEGDINNWHDFWVLYLKNIGQPEKIDELMVLSNKRNEENLIANKDMLNLVDNLKSKGYKTGLLSNNTLENGKKLREMGIDKHFYVFHISAETSKQKPSLAAFEEFISALGVKASEMIFIDDAEKSLSTATECGFTPVLFKSYKELVIQLEELGL